MTTELDTFYEMVEDIGIAMMTTGGPTGISSPARWRIRSVRQEPTCGS